MRIYTFVTLCACALYASAASVPLPERQIDALDNVDLDNGDPELIDQPSVEDIDNSLRKVSDIPVKVVDTPVILDETSNEYVPDQDESINVKRIEIDLNNPGPPQRQEHETQNPGNYGERERAVYQILQKAKEAQSIFTKGVKDISDSFYNLNKHSDEIPAVLENIKKLNYSFSNEIIELNNTIRTYLEPKPAQDDEQKNNLKLNYVESKLQNLQSNFNHGVDILNEGFELLSILQEEDEAAKSETKSLVKEENESVKEDASSSAPSSSTAAPAPIQVPANGFNAFLGFFSTTVSNMLSNVTSVFQNNLAQPINIFQGFRPTTVKPAQKPQDSKPSGAQSDEAGSAPAPTPAPASPQWGPQAFFQQFQNSIQNLVNGGQGNLPSQAPAQPAPNGPISQAIQNIVQFIQRPGQALSPQPANPSSVPQNPVSQSVPPKNPESVPPPQADAIPAPASVPVAAPVPAAPQVVQPAQIAAASQPAIVSQPAAQQVPAQEQPAQGGPIQQLVQNNPIIKGIQSAVQRIQGTPNSADTPRNEEKNEKESLENKGHGHGGNNQGSTDDSGRLDVRMEEQNGKPVAVLAEASFEAAIKPEEVKMSADKTD